MGKWKEAGVMRVNIDTMQGKTKRRSKTRERETTKC